MQGVWNQWQEKIPVALSFWLSESKSSNDPLAPFILVWCAPGPLLGPPQVIPVCRAKFVAWRLRVQAFFAPATYEFRFVCGPHIKITVSNPNLVGGTDKYQSHVLPSFFFRGHLAFTQSECYYVYRLVPRVLPIGPYLLCRAEFIM